MNHPNISDGSDDDIEQLFRAFVFEACIDIIAHSVPGIPSEVDEQFLRSALEFNKQKMRSIVQKAKADPRVMEMLRNGYKKEFENRLLRLQ